MPVLGVSCCPFHRSAPICARLRLHLFQGSTLAVLDRTRIRNGCLSHHVARPDSMGEFGQARQALPVGCRSNTTDNTYQMAKGRWVHDTTYDKN
ncbi:MAG: hypothetical protein RI918_1125 [Pseudomonadota bacterium]|jgi:hypothetical protein